MTLDALASEIFLAASEALGVGAKLVELRAKRHAPVRSIFAGTPVDEESGYVRFFSATELAPERSHQVRHGLPPTPGSVSTHHAPRWWRERTMPTATWLLEAGYVEHKRDYYKDQEPIRGLLSKRGAYEVRTKRAKFAQWGHLYIGGRLRGEIFSTSVSMGDGRAEAWVISPTKYARYQEYGTRHNRAHPFLRPAAEESREEVSALIKGAIERASRTGASSTEIELVVRL